MSQVSLLEGLKQDLAELVAIPSISAAGYPEPTRRQLLDAFEHVTELFRAAGVQNLGSLDLPDTAPVLTGEIPAPDGRADRPALQPLRRRARGGRVAVDVAAVRARSSATARSTVAAAPTPRPTSSPTSARCGRGTGGRRSGIKLVIEGQEEVGGGALTTYPPTAPEAFACDAMVIGDMGSVRPGVPTLTVALRGMAMVTVEVTTLAGAKHSGQFGGAAPDALLAVLRALVDAARRRRRRRRGRPAARGVGRRVLQRRRVPRARRGPRRDAADRHRRARLARVVGAGDHGHRASTCRRVDNALNAVSPHARATINLRVHPEQDAVEAQAALVAPSARRSGRSGSSSR